MKILCLGEVLIDMLSQGAAPKDGNIPAMKPFQPYAGGAPANVAVAVAQLGGESAMVSKVGDDTFGAFLKIFNSFELITSNTSGGSSKVRLTDNAPRRRRLRSKQQQQNI